jgi:hypothetical protein
VQFVEDVDAAVLKNFQDITLADGYATKTLRNRLMTVAEMLTHAGSTTQVKWKDARHRRKGVALADLKDWLGHEDLKTTSTYLGSESLHAKHVRAAADAVLSF